MRNFPAGRLWLLIVTTACPCSLVHFGESATDTGEPGTPVREAIAPCNTEQGGVQQRPVDRNSYYSYPRPIYDYPKSHSEPKECVTEQRHLPMCSCSTPKRTHIYDTPRPWNASQSRVENKDSPTRVGGNYTASHTSPPPTGSSTLPSPKSSSSDFDWLKSGTQYGGKVSPQNRISSSAFRGFGEPQDFGALPGKQMPASSTETEIASLEGNPTSAVWNTPSSRKQDEKEQWKLMPCGTLPSKRMPATSPEMEKVSPEGNPTSAMRNSLSSREEDEKEHWKSMPMLAFPDDSPRQSSEKSHVSIPPYDLIDAFLNGAPQEEAPHVDRRTDSHRFSLRLPLFNQKSKRKPSPMPRTLRRNSSKKGTSESSSSNKLEGSTNTDTVAPKRVVREQRELPTPPAEVFQTRSVREQRELPKPPAEVYQKHTVREQRELPMPPVKLSNRSSMQQKPEEEEVINPQSTDILASRDQLIREKLSPHVLNAVLKVEQRILKALQEGALMEFLSSPTGAEQFLFFAHVAARFSEGLNLTPAERLFVMWAQECPKLTQYCSLELLLEMVNIFEFIAGVRRLEVPPAVKVLLTSATKGDRASLMEATSSTPAAESTKSRGKLSAEPFGLFLHRVSSDDVRRQVVHDLMANWSQFASEIKNLVYHKHIRKSMDYPSYRTRFIVYAYTGAAMLFNEETNFFPQNAPDPIEDALNKCFRDTNLARRIADPEVRTTFLGEIRVKYS